MDNKEFDIKKIEDIAEEIYSKIEPLYTEHEDTLEINTNNGNRSLKLHIAKGGQAHKLIEEMMKEEAAKLINGENEGTF